MPRDAAPPATPRDAALPATPPDKAPTIETPRLTLRASRASDFDAYAAMWADPRVTNFIGGAPRPRDEAWRRFCQGAGFWPLFGYGYWLIADRDSDALLGIGGFGQFERDIAILGVVPEIGWALVPAAWGRGIAREAVGGFVAWSDAHLAAAETGCIISPGNTASVRVAEICGYSAVGDTRYCDEPTIVFKRARKAAAPSAARAIE